MDQAKREFIKQLYSDYNYSISTFDNQTLYISSAALGISLAFIKDIVPISQATHFWLFQLALWIFVVVILVSFIAHYVSSHKINRAIQLADAEQYDQIKEDKLVPFLNMTLIILLVSGILGLVQFVNINLSSMNVEKTNHSIQSEKNNSATKRGAPNPGELGYKEKALPLKPLPADLKPNTTSDKK